MTAQSLLEIDRLPSLIGELALFPSEKWQNEVAGKPEGIATTNLVLQKIHTEIEELRWLRETTTHLYCRTERIRGISGAKNSAIAEFAYIPTPGLKNGTRVKHPCEVGNRRKTQSILTEAPAQRCRELAWLIPYKTTGAERLLIFILTFDPSVEILVRTFPKEWEACTGYWKKAARDQGLVRPTESTSCIHAFTGIHEWMQIIATQDSEETPAQWKRHQVSPEETRHAANCGLDIYYSNSIVAYAWSTLEKQKGRERARAILQQNICKRVVLFDPIYGSSQGLKSQQREEPITFLLPGDTEREKTAKSFWDNTILTAHTTGASDIHIEPLQSAGRPSCDLIVSLRKDSQLNFFSKIPSELAPDYVRFALETSGIIKEENHRPQDGRRGWVNPETKEAIDLRISVTPVGAPIQKIVMRLLDTNKLRRGITDLDLEPWEVQLWEKALRLNQSLVLVSGPTNSGKSEPGSTRILTDKGVLRLKEIVTRHEAGERFNTWNEAGWEPITNVHRCGVKEVVEIHTESGSLLEVAGTHPFLKLEENLEAGWHATKNLSPGDTLLFQGNHPQDQRGDPNKYYQAGKDTAHLTTGTKAKEDQTQCIDRAELKALLDYLPTKSAQMIVDKVIEEWNENAKIVLNKASGQTEKHAAAHKTVGTALPLGCLKLAGLAKELETHYANSDRPHIREPEFQQAIAETVTGLKSILTTETNPEEDTIPEKLWEAPSVEIAGFFSGWIDAGGRLKKKGVELKAKNEATARTAKRLLAALGIRSWISEKKTTWRISIRSLQSRNKTAFPITQPKKLKARVRNAITAAYGTNTPKRKLRLKTKGKRVRVSALRKLFAKAPKALASVPEIKRILTNRLEPEKITKIVQTGRMEEMFDIEVGQNHTYCIEGLICHNSTTLYAALLTIFQRDNRRSFATIEDPVEYRLPFRATQSPVNPERGASYAQLIRQAMRNDGDTFLIGEIRDLPTAGAALQLSLTGHQVLSSIHANSATETALRLLEFGVEPFILEETVKLIVAQRLIPTGCPQCTHPIPPTEVGSTLRKNGGEILMETWNPLWERTYRRKSNWVTSEGCAYCQYTGLLGQRAAQEFLVIDQKNKKALREGNIEALSASMKERSHNTMEETIWRFAWQGKIPVSQAGELTNQIKEA